MPQDQLKRLEQQAIRSLHRRTGGTGRVLLALSGGVDSALSALLVRRAELEAEAVFVQNWDRDEGSEECTVAEDYASAAQVCEHLQIPLRQASFIPEYWQQVFEPMVAGYSRGDTPNPDVLCNRHIKFGVLSEYCRAGGFAWLATGHYCRIGEASGQQTLLQGVDSDKDQSYFLQDIEPEVLQRVLFPIGGLMRSEVRQIARQNGLGNWDRPGSTGICFIGERRFSRFLSEHLRTQPGDIITPTGEVIGSHAGAALYTVGQRKGLGIGGIAGGRQAPWFVAAVDIKANRIVAVQEGDPALYHRQLRTAPPRWIGPPPALPGKLHARIRYRQSSQPCIVSAADDGCDVVFHQPQRAPAVGQYCAFYLGERCLGGGQIMAVGEDEAELRRQRNGDNSPMAAMGQTP